MSQKIFLARKGKIEGPFDQKTFRKLEESGEIDQYSWIWDMQASAWKPLDAAPLSAPEGFGEDFQPDQSQQNERAANVVTFHPGKPVNKSDAKKTESLLAVCHDFQSVVSGSLADISENGCELRTEDHSPGPRLANHSKVLLNLLDSKTGKAINVSAQIRGIEKRDAKWSYRIQWKELPRVS